MKDEKTTTKPTFDPEVPPREGFIFYRTFYEALAGKSSVSCPLKPSDSAPLC